MIIYKKYMTFQVLGQDINIISDETDNGRNTIAEMSNQYYYLGDEAPNLMTAIFAWQEVNGRSLSEKETHQVMTDNGFVVV